MAPQNNAKPKRHKKRKSRTEVSSDSESEPEISVPRSTSEPTKESEKLSKKSKPKSKSSPPDSTTPKILNDAEVEAAFTKFYLQRVTTEFEDDLDNLRKADDFKDDALTILIGALQQGTGLFGMEEKRRIVEAGRGKGGD